MRAIILAFSLIRVPKLFVSLLLWPMVIGVSVALCQAVASSVYFGLSSESPEQFSKRFKNQDEHSWLRAMLFGSELPLEQIRLCRWHFQDGKEVPVDDSCQMLPNDVAIHSANPAAYDPTELLEFFEGSTRQIHLCQSCPADIIIKGDGEERVSQVFGIRALGVVMLTDSEVRSRVGDHYIAAKADLDELRNIAGTVLLQPEGSTHLINMSQATKIMVLILNTAAITIIALWLSLKGHRKVLEYFAKNGALLPLVAACGKNTFYAALWIITLFRVGLFLLAVLPTTIIVYSHSVPKETLDIFIRDGAEFVLWISGIVASLSCLAIVASISELKQRHCFISFLYRYVPIALCLLGTGIWFTALFTDGPQAQMVQNIIAAIPVLGISPIIISPLFWIEPSIIALHCTLAAVLILIMMKLNSQWFAAHLEEL